MCQGYEKVRSRKIRSHILPVQISMWSQHLLTVIPSEVEESVAKLSGDITGCLDPLDMTTYS